MMMHHLLLRFGAHQPLATMAAQDQDDLLRLLERVRALQPRDGTGANIQTEIEQKLRAYLRPGASQAAADSGAGAKIPPAAPGGTGATRVPGMGAGRW
jgi:hypothetical protein